MRAPVQTPEKMAASGRRCCGTCRTFTLHSKQWGDCLSQAVRGPKSIPLRLTHTQHIENGTSCPWYRKRTELFTNPVTAKG